MSSDGMETITVSMPPSLAEEIEGQLDWGDSRAAWIREACDQRLTREDSKNSGAQGE